MAPTFEEAVKTITDPNYGLGVVTLWQLPPDWPGTEGAKVHDLRYDYLVPGESTFKIDVECRDSWIREGCCATQIAAFYRVMRLWGEIFQEGEHICDLFGQNHSWNPCSYGQKDKYYDMRCGICGVHRPFTDEEVINILVCY